MSKGSIVKSYVELWPREVFDIREEKNRLLKKVQDNLDGPGAYVLYRDDEPYYIGKTDNKLYDRIYQHANRPAAKYFRYWNYFPAYKVSELSHITDIEGILITAIPKAANSSKPKIERIQVPKCAIALMGH